MSLICADARALPLRDESVQCVVTSPPYFGLRDYGGENQLGRELTPERYIGHIVLAMEECRRVLHPSGVLWLNVGDSYAAAPPGGQGASSTLRGRKVADAQNVQRESVQFNAKPKDLLGIPWAIAFALRAAGWFLRSDCIWSKLNPIPESVRDRPTKAHEYVFLLSKRARYYYNAAAVKERGTGRAPGNTGPHKYALAAEVSDVSGLHRTTAGIERIREGYETRNLRTVWPMASQPYHGEHPATFPELLAQRCILAGSRSGDIVLDPFAGSGTTVRVARSLGRKGIGCDISAEFLRSDAASRIQVTGGLPF